MPLFRIIPSFRAPRTIAGFDYATPEGMDIAIGDLVRMPFRKQTIVGVVAESLTTSAVPKKFLKEVTGSYAGLRVSEQTLALLNALAIRSCTSPASVLHAWMGTLPKRPDTGVASRRNIKHHRYPKTNTRLLLHHWNHPEGVIATAKNTVADGGRVLVLTPWAEHARALAEACAGVALTSDLADGARFRAWTRFLRGDVQCLVATRIGAWLATEADLVIVDEPENDDHKQDELAPRYDARWMAAEAQKLGASVVAIGLTPRLISSQQAPDAPIPEIPNSHITWVDTNRADWSSVAGLQGRSLLHIEEATEAGHPATVIHPIHGLRARLRCADCGWSGLCSRCGGGLTPTRDTLMCQRCNNKEPMPAACPQCGGTDFSKSRPGRDALIRDLQHHGLAASVLSIGEWHASFTTCAPQSIVVLTDFSLLAGMSEDIRRRERLMIALRRLADACAARDTHLVVQGDASLLDDARLWLTSEGCATALTREWEERNAFHLPPTMRLVKLIVRGTGAIADGVIAALHSRLPNNATTSGPFAVERLPGTRMPRSIIHITFPPNTPDTAIQRVISPVLTSNILVDLDPISLFE